jgi:myotubularin-related protein 1/2
MSEDQRSWIFLQWLDCVNQILFNFPHAFEFNMDLLIFLASNYNVCLYGTFLYNNDKEREENNAYTETVSIWTDILNAKNINKFLNPFYKPNSIKELLNFNFGYHKLRIWDDFYLRHHLSNSIKVHFIDKMAKK